MSTVTNDFTPSTIIHNDSNGQSYLLAVNPHSFQLAAKNERFWEASPLTTTSTTEYRVASELSYDSIFGLILRAAQVEDVIDFCFTSESDRDLFWRFQVRRKVTTLPPNEFVAPSKTISIIFERSIVLSTHYVLQKKPAQSFELTVGGSTSYYNVVTYHVQHSNLREADRIATKILNKLD